MFYLKCYEVFVRIGWPLDAELSSTKIFMYFTGCTILRGLKILEFSEENHVY